VLFEEVNHLLIASPVGAMGAPAADYFIRSFLFRPQESVKDKIVIRPDGSSTLRSAAGSVARHAKRLQTTIPPKRACRARRSHRSMVGSLTISSAVDGLSRMKARDAAPESHVLSSQYRYFMHSEKMARL
jgi:hypothetical protein